MKSFCTLWTLTFNSESSLEVLNDFNREDSLNRYLLCDTFMWSEKALIRIITSYCPGIGQRIQNSKSGSDQCRNFSLNLYFYA